MGLTLCQYISIFLIKVCAVFHKVDLNINLLFLMFNFSLYLRKFFKILPYIYKSLTLCTIIIPEFFQVSRLACS